MKKMSIFFSVLFLMLSMNVLAEKTTDTQVSAGSIQVFIAPEECQMSFSFFMLEIGMWSAWFPSGSVINNILPGQVEVRFRQTVGWLTQANQTITVESNKMASLSVACCPEQPDAPIIYSVGKGTSTEIVSIKWKENHCVDYYKLYRGLTNNIHERELLAQQIEGSEYTDNTAEPGKQYYYWVHSANLYMYSEPSQCVIGYLKLHSPQNVIASNKDYTQYVLLTFDKVEGASEYNIFRNNEPDLSYAVKIGTVTKGYFEDTSAIYEKPYYYWVVSENEFTTSVSTSVAGKRKMPAVETVLASDCENNDSVNIEFQSIGDNFRYFCVRDEISNSENTVIFSNYYDGKFLDDTVEAGKKYLYRIRAANEYGSSLSAPDEGSACDANSQATCFKSIIEAGEPDIGSFSYWMSSISSWSTKYPSDTLICNLEPGQINVRYNEEPGWITPEEKNITLEANKTIVDNVRYCPQTPATPLNVRASDATSTDHIVIQWDSNPCENHYLIYRGVNNHPDNSTLLADNIINNEYRDNTAEQGMMYYYWIVADNQYEKSERSHYDTGFIELTPPADVYASSTNFQKPYIRVSFSSVEGAINYEIWRGVLSNPAYAKYIGSVTETVYDDQATVYEKPYYYWIKSVNNFSKSSFSSYAMGKALMPKVDYVIASHQEYENMVKIEFIKIGDEAYHGIVYSFIRDEMGLRNKTLRSSINWDGQFEDRTAYPGKIYYYRIKAQNAYGYSISNACRGSSKIGSVTGLKASQSDHLCKIRLDWNHVENSKFYEIYRNTTNDLSTAIKMESMTNFFWDNVERSYFYWVKAANEYTTSDDNNQGYVLGAPATCEYNTSDSEIIFDHNGGTASFTVIPNYSSPECVWRVSSSADWINNITPEYGTGEQTITFTIDPNNIPLTGTIDIDGDNSFCNYSHSSVQVVNNRFKISGNILYYSNDIPIEGVKLNLDGGSMHLDTYTDENGAYVFPPSPNGNYGVTPYHTATIPEMVITPFDASLVFRNMRNVISLDDYQKLAADINADGDQDVFDIVLILLYSMGHTENFNKDAWLFNPVSINYSLDQDISDHYKGIVLGDVSGNWKPEGENQIPVITDAMFCVTLPDISGVTTGDLIQIPVSITPTASADIYSYYADIAYDPEVLTFTNVSMDNYDSENWTYPSTNKSLAGKIRIVACGATPLNIDDDLFKLHFTVLGNINDSSLLTFETFLFNEGFPSVSTKNGSVSIVEKNTYILDLDIIGNGQILLNDTLEILPWKGIFSENQTIQLEAIPSENFFQWMGDIVDSNNRVSVIMNRNRQIKAVFNRFDFVLKKGWNLISLPVIPFDNQLTSIFPDAQIAYEFQNGRYIPVNRLIQGKGYWVKIPSDAIYPIGGLPFSSFIADFNPGWHLIGATDQIRTPEDFSLTGISAIYEFYDGYLVANQFEPGKGYWIKVE
jgi:hypothetical protein